MSGFFGFDSALPERRDAPEQFTQAGAEEDLAVYTWGEEGYDGLGNALLEGGDDMNDETFGDDVGTIGEISVLCVRRDSGLMRVVRRKRFPVLSTTSTATVRSSTTGVQPQFFHPADCSEAFESASRPLCVF